MLSPSLAHTVSELDSLNYSQNYMYYIVLYRIILYYIVLYCIILYYIVLYCIILCYIVLYCIYYNLGNIMNHKNTLQFKDDVIISTKAKRIITQFLEDA